MRTHDVKCHPGPFQDVWDGKKPYEIRKDDRDYCVGDALILSEWDPSPHPVLSDREAGYTGRVISTVITYKTTGGRYGLPVDLCVLALGELHRSEERAVAP